MRGRWIDCSYSVLSLEAVTVYVSLPTRYTSFERIVIQLLTDAMRERYNLCEKQDADRDGASFKRIDTLKAQWCFVLRKVEGRETSM